MGRHIFITGANSDIGIALCRLYLASGHRIFAHYRQNNEKFTHLLEEAGSKMVLFQGDFRNSDTVETMLAAHDGAILGTDIFIHLASMRESLPFSEINSEILLRHLTANLLPALLFMRTLGPRMVSRGWGRIVLGGSIGVKFGGGSSSFCYSLSKHALEFIPAVHKEWAVHDVLINTVRIGVTDTRLFSGEERLSLPKRVALIPIKRSAEPEEMAELIYWLGSEKNTYVTGQVISASGGE